LALAWGSWGYLGLAWASTPTDMCSSERVRAFQFCFQIFHIFSKHFFNLFGQTFFQTFIFYFWPLLVLA
jgi:hypothetical protein